MLRESVERVLGMKGRHAFLAGVVISLVSIAFFLGTTSFLEYVQNKGYEKGFKAGIEKGKEQTMKDIELSYDMCVKKKGE